MWVVVDRGHDVWVFRSRETAEDWMEPADVRDGEYRVFDEDGLEYSVDADSDDSPVLIGEPFAGPSSPGLEPIVRDFVHRMPPSKLSQEIDAAGDDIAAIVRLLAR
jgi:hypothetical protein